jgi:hypothetical protein
LKRKVSSLIDGNSIFNKIVSNLEGISTDFYYFINCDFHFKNTKESIVSFKGQPKSIRFMPF